MQEIHTTIQYRIFYFTLYSLQT